jgi:hypothetical protein
VKPIKVIAAAFLIFGPIADNRPRNRQNPVRDRDRGFLHASPMRDPVEHSGEKAIPRTCRRPCTLHQNAAHVAVTLTRTAGEPLPRAFRIAGALSGIFEAFSRVWQPRCVFPSVFGVFD